MARSGSPGDHALRRALGRGPLPPLPPPVVSREMSRDRQKAGRPGGATSRSRRAVTPKPWDRARDLQTLLRLSSTRRPTSSCTPEKNRCHPPPPPFRNRRIRKAPALWAKKRGVRCGGGGGQSTDIKLSRIVLGELDPRHKRLSILSTAPLREGAMLLRLGGEGERYCPNMQREHSQSTVFCIVDARGVSMRCHCKKFTCPRYWKTWPLSMEGSRLVGFQPQKSGMPHGFV